MEFLPISVQKLEAYAGPDAVLTPAYEGDAGVDLYSTVDVELLPGERFLVPTGIKIALPRGYEAQIRPRSGNAIKLGLTIINTPGTIDADYRGEIMVPLYNANPTIGNLELKWLRDWMHDIQCRTVPYRSPYSIFGEHTRKNTIQIRRGDKIAQMVIARVVSPSATLVDKLPVSSRGEQGFGSSGVVGQ